MAFERNLRALLEKWKKKKSRKPLVIRGARQVGKTNLILDFAQSFAHKIILNLEKPADRRYFDDFDTVQSIVEALLLEKGIPSKKMNQTLLFIDEIQESPKAIHLLRYFYEEMPELFIICAGSLLEFAIKDVPGFPVGRVEFLYLYPLNFSEYLTALGKPNLLRELQIIPVRSVAQRLLKEAFHRYAVIGGMPEVVKTDTDIKNLSDLIPVYESIWETYKDDVEKYAVNESERRVIKHIINVAPLYLDKRIKFQRFGNSNYRSREVGEAFRKLEDAGIIRMIYPTTDIQPPLKPNVRKAPRLQFLDTGIVNHTLGIQSEMLAMDDLNNAYKGAVIPHLITQEIISNQVQSNQKPKFWVREKKQSDAEVDILFVYKKIVIPIEIKSGSTGTLRSLHQFIEVAEHPYAIRMYAGNFKVEKAVTPINRKPYWLMNLPYYTANVLAEYIDWFVNNYDKK